MIKLDTEKRFWLFVYDSYYPGGGMSDFKDSYDSIEEVIELIIKEKHLFGNYDLFDSIERRTLTLYGDQRKNEYEFKYD